MAPTPLELPSVTKLYGVSKDDLLAYEAEGLVRRSVSATIGIIRQKISSGSKLY